MIPTYLIQLGRPHRLGALIPRRHGVAHHLAHRFPRQPELAGRFPFAHSLDDDRSPPSRIQFHGVHLMRVP